MTAFETFETMHGPALERRAVSESTIAKYRGVLPDSLLTHWREVGWCGYAGGLLWVVDPDELRKPLAEWLGPEAAAGAHAIVRTALGDVIYWSAGRGWYLDVKYDGLFEKTSDVDILFEFSFCDDEFLDKAVGRKLFEQARARLSVLRSDECYGFVPALALGGSGAADTLRVVKLREYLSLLAQLRGK